MVVGVFLGVLFKLPVSLMFFILFIELGLSGITHLKSVHFYGFRLVEGNQRLIIGKRRGSIIGAPFSIGFF
jgi:hypothetical protein